MRTSLLFGLAGIAVVGGALDAEAQDGLPPVPGPASEIRHVSDASAPGLAIRPNGDRPTYVVLPPPAESKPEAAGPAQKPSGQPAAGFRAPETAKPVVEAAPWCRSRAVVGTGVGFCLVN